MYSVWLFFFALGFHFDTERSEIKKTTIILTVVLQLKIEAVSASVADHENNGF